MENTASFFQYNNPMENKTLLKETVINTEQQILMVRIVLIRVLWKPRSTHRETQKNLQIAMATIPTHCAKLHFWRKLPHNAYLDKPVKKWENIVWSMRQNGNLIRHTIYVGRTALLITPKTPSQKWTLKVKKIMVRSILSYSTGRIQTIDRWTKGWGGMGGGVYLFFFSCTMK